jgi:monoamine oxidase
MGSVDVVVVGAGVAGLSAAIALQRSSRNVVVLEARSRVGGRVFTSPRGLEWGAMWLHGTRGHPLLQHNVECELVEVVPDCWWRCGFPEETCLVYNSIPVSQAEFESSWETYQRISRGIGLEITEAHKEIPADVVFFSFVKEHFPQVVEDLRLMNTIKWFLYKIEDWMGEALHELSAHDVFSGSPALWGDFPGSHAIVKGGMLKLIERILDKYDIKVFHDKPVAHIDYSGEKARVLCEDGTEYIADKVISAVPVAVLNNKSIRFSPEVPKTYQDIFSRYGQSNCLKIFLEFKSCFWSSFDSQWDKTFWGFIGDQSRWGEYWIWVNLTRVLDRPVLNIDVVGEMQEELESRSSEQVGNSEIP